MLSLKTGAVAQLGERLNGIQEVVGSTPISSILIYQGFAKNHKSIIFLHCKKIVRIRYFFERSLDRHNSLDKSQIKTEASCYHAHLPVRVLPQTPCNPRSLSLTLTVESIICARPSLWIISSMRTPPP